MLVKFGTVFFGFVLLSSLNGKKFTGSSFKNQLQGHVEDGQRFVHQTLQSPLNWHCQIFFFFFSFEGRRRDVKLWNMSNVQIPFSFVHRLVN